MMGRDWHTTRRKTSKRAAAEALIAADSVCSDGQQHDLQSRKRLRASAGRLPLSIRPCTRCAAGYAHATLTSLFTAGAPAAPSQPWINAAVASVRYPDTICIMKQGCEHLSVDRDEVNGRSWCSCPVTLREVDWHAAIAEIDAVPNNKTCNAHHKLAAGASLTLVSSDAQLQPALDALKASMEVGPLTPMLQIMQQLISETASQFGWNLAHEPILLPLMSHQV